MSVSNIPVGQVEGKSFALPLDVQTVTTAVLGIRGTGKTNTAGVITEGLLRHDRQVVIVDPTDAWWGLKASRDGRQEGLSVLVIGGDHGDIPLGERDGPTIADFLVEERVSAVLSVRHLRKGQFRHLVTELTEQLFYRKGKPEFRTPLLYVIDECDQFIPQKVGGAEARMVGAVEDVVRRGRNAGLGCMLISQRAASVNKDVLTQLELLIAHRHTSPQDRKALLEWVQAHDVDDRSAEFMASLAALQRGEAWFWSPGWLDVFKRVQVDLRSTFDSSATPEAGRKIHAPKKLAEVDLDKIKGKLAQSIERAKADDPRELKRKIAELEKAIAAGKMTVSNAARMEPKRVEVPVIKDSQVKALDNIVGKLMAFVTKGQEVANAVASAIKQAQLKPVPKILPSPHKPLILPSPHKPLMSPFPAVRKEPKPADPSNNGELGKGESAILAACIGFPEGLRRKQLTVLTGYKRSSRDTYIQRLRSSGHVEQRGELIVATPAGIEALPDAQPLPRGEELQAFWRQRLGEGERAILDVLIEAYPQAVARELLSERTAYQRSSRDTYLQRLRAKQLIVEPARGEVRASETLFE